MNKKIVCQVGNNKKVIRFISIKRTKIFYQENISNTEVHRVITCS